MFLFVRVKSNPRKARSPKSVSMEGIAEGLGVSTATISRALNDKPGVSAQLRKQIKSLLKEANYQKRTTRDRSKSRLNTIAYVVWERLFEKVNQGDEFYGRHLVAVQKAIAEAGGYSLLVGYEQDMTPDRKLRCVETRRVQGIIGEGNPEDYTKHVTGDVPVVLMNRESPDWSVDAVTTDMQAVANQQLRYLYDLGHRRIACFRLNTKTSNWENRRYWQEYYSFCNQYDLQLPEEYRYPIEFGYMEDPQAIHGFLDRVMQSARPPTAIVTYDSYAPEIIRQLVSRGYKVPTDVSVCGMNDIIQGEICGTTLTSYRQDFDSMAREAVRMLMSRLENPELPPRLVRLSGKLILRGSTVPPRHP